MSKRSDRNNKYPFGKETTEDNYDALRKLAQKLSFKDFNEATGLEHGMHTNLRRFPAFEGYKRYTAENREKYGAKRPEEKVTLRDVYQKLIEIEKKLA